ncbi:MAG: hypothetical protein AABX75_00505 [Nanoarchaeota archaeon]
MAEPTKQLIYYTYDSDGRIRHTVCLMELKRQKQGVPGVMYAKGVCYLSNQDYVNDNFSIRAGVGVSKERAEKVVDWFESGAWFEKGYSTRKTFGKGKGKISADKMQLLEEKDLTPRDKAELGLEQIITAPKARESRLDSEDTGILPHVETRA